VSSFKNGKEAESPEKTGFLGRLFVDRDESFVIMTLIFPR
jgi:hypothetical protein